MCVDGPFCSKIMAFLNGNRIFLSEIALKKKDKFTFARKSLFKMADDSIFLIDIEKILKQKTGKNFKYIPRFVISYLKRIVHQDELNVFLSEKGDKVGVEFLEACMEFLDDKIEIKRMCIGHQPASFPFL